MGHIWPVDYTEETFRAGELLPASWSLGSSPGPVGTLPLSIGHGSLDIPTTGAVLALWQRNARRYWSNGLRYF
jgi:hypothetical protein